MEFDTSYWNAMDKKQMQAMNIDAGQVGISTTPMQHQVQALSGRIRAGAKHVELGFMGQDKGSSSGGRYTPETYGTEERQAMKQLAKINKVELSTHATPITGVTGRTGRSSFNEHIRERTLADMRKTIDFAGEVADGGPVVIHTGEYDRPVADQYPEFELYPGEKEETVIPLVDIQTGQGISAIQKNSKIWVPRHRDKDTDLPALNPETGTFDLVQRDYEWYAEHQAELNAKEHARYEAEGRKWTDKTPAQLMFRDNTKIKRDYAHGFGKSHEDAYRAGRAGNIPDLETLREHLPNAPDEILKQIQNEAKLKAKEGGRDSDREMAISQLQQAKEYEDMMDRAVPVKDFAKEKSLDSYARLGIYAMERSKTTSKPIFIAPENIWAEFGYGSHPEELKEIINDSRNKMVKILHEEKGVSPQEAAKLAEQHIKATFDIGHLNTWKKLFKKEHPEESEEDRSARFKDWVRRQTENISPVTGHVHVTDNFGYEDEHLLPGQGNAPIKEFVSHFKKKGYKGPFVVEPAQHENQGLPAMWRTLESPIYRTAEATRRWTEVEGGYFGKTASPTFATPAYLPVGSPNETLTWSGVPLE